MTNTDALWVRILRSKYNIHGIIPNDLNRSNCSYIWRSIAKVWGEVKKGFVWIIQDGRITNFWNDVWIHDLGPLKSHFIGRGNLDETICVCDVLTAEGDWNTTWLSTVLPREIVSRVQACNSPVGGSGVDHLSWRWMTAGKFSIRESYKYICCTSTLDQLKDDETIWKMKVPQRVKTFLWMPVRNKILTNAKHVRRDMSFSPFCEQCGKLHEFAIHVVRDCVFLNLCGNKCYLGMFGMFFLILILGNGYIGMS